MIKKYRFWVVSIRVKIFNISISLVLFFAFNLHEKVQKVETVEITGLLWRVFKTECMHCST